GAGEQPRRRGGAGATPPRPALRARRQRAPPVPESPRRSSTALPDSSRDGTGVARRRHRRRLRRRPGDLHACLAAAVGRRGHRIGTLGAGSRRPAVPRPVRAGNRAPVTRTSGVTVRGLTCTYEGGSRPALAGVDCDVPPGSLTV